MSFISALIKILTVYSAVKRPKKFVERRVRNAVWKKLF